MEASAEALPFDLDYLMIAATALAHDLPLCRLNARDLRGLDGLVEIVDLGARIGT